MAHVCESTITEIYFNVNKICKRQVFIKFLQATLKCKKFNILKNVLFVTQRLSVNKLCHFQVKQHFHQVSLIAEEVYSLAHN